MLSRGGLRSVAARRRCSYRSLSYDIKKVGVVGLGLMGHGIGLVSAHAGYEVVAVETNPDALETAKHRIHSSLKKLLSKDAPLLMSLLAAKNVHLKSWSVEKGKLTKDAAEAQAKQVEGRIKYTLDLQDLKDVDMVVEAIVENIDVKVPFYQKLGEIVQPNAIFGSNTSSLAISDFSKASGRPDKVVGLHFFNPVQVMKLVEVIKTDDTDNEVYTAAKEYVKKIGKTPVTCGDTPGFIVNRLLVPALAQAIAMLDRGDATIEDIDLAMQLGAGHPMGPIHLADYVGLDTTLSILDGWVRKYPNEPAYFVPKSLREKVKAGKLGRKSGEGYYKWEGDKKIGPA